MASGKVSECKLYKKSKNGGCGAEVCVGHVYIREEGVV